MCTDLLMSIGDGVSYCGGDGWLTICTRTESDGKCAESGPLLVPVVGAVVGSPVGGVRVVDLASGGIEMVDDLLVDLDMTALTTIGIAA